MTLIGCILSTINFIYYATIGVIDRFIRQADNQKIYKFIQNQGMQIQQNAQLQETGDLMLGLAFLFLILGLIVSIAFLILDWIAFTKLDGPKAKGWRIYLLVLGIALLPMAILGTVNILLNPHSLSGLREYYYLPWHGLHFATGIFFIMGSTLNSQND